MSLLEAHAQTPPAYTQPPDGALQDDDERRAGPRSDHPPLERDAGTGSGPHRHPGSHTFGYVLEGSYEVKVGDGPLQKLGPGGTFYESPERCTESRATAARPNPSSIWSSRSPIRPTADRARVRGR